MMMMNDEMNNPKNCQTLIRQVHTLERELTDSVSRLRSSLVSLEGAWTTTKTMERIIRTSTNTSSTIGTCANRPFSYTKERAYIKLITTLRKDPALLGEALATWVKRQSNNTGMQEKSSVISESNAALAMGIVNDIYLADGHVFWMENQCRIVIINMIKTLKYKYSEVYLLDIYAFPLVLMKEFAYKVGYTYICSVLKETVSIILDECYDVDLTAELLNSYSSSTTTTNNTNTDSSLNNNNNNRRLVAICTKLFDKLLSSINIFPDSCKKIAKELLVISQPQPQSSSSSPIDKQHNNEEITDWRGTVDFIFVHWIINALVFPENYGLSDQKAIGDTSRRNLEVIGTVLVKTCAHAIKLHDDNATTTKTTEEDGKENNDELVVSPGGSVSPINDLLNKYGEKLAIFIDNILNVSDNNDDDDYNHDSILELQPIVMLPNELIQIHHIMHTYYFPLDKKEETGELTANIIAFDSTSEHTLTDESVRKLLQTVPGKFFQHDRNGYVLFYNGVPLSELDDVLCKLSIEAPKNDKSVNLTEFYTIRALRHTLSVLPPLKDVKYSNNNNNNNLQLIYLLEYEGNKLLSYNKDPAKGYLVMETVQLLKDLHRHNNNDNKDNKDNQSIIMQLTIQLKKQMKLLNNSNISYKTMHYERLALDTQNYLKKRRFECTSRMKYIKFSPILATLHDKIRALKKFLRAQNNKDAKEFYSPLLSDPSIDPSSVILCTSPCPETVDRDRYICRMCGRIMDRRKAFLKSFMNKYALDKNKIFSSDPLMVFFMLQISKTANQQSQSQSLFSNTGAVLVTDPLFISAVTDHTVLLAHDELFVKCELSSRIWKEKTTFLKKKFSSFPLFFHSISDTQKKVPYISDNTITACVSELKMLSKTRSLSNKLHYIVRSTAILSSVLHHASLSSIRHLTDIPSEKLVDNHAVSFEMTAEDYMSALCYVLLHVENEDFLCDLQFMSTMSKNCLQIKGFVDICMATKYILSQETEKSDTKV